MNPDNVQCPETTSQMPHDTLGPVLTCMHDIEPRPIQWLWPARIPLGRTSLMIGRPDVGKSFLTIDMAARISLGKAWPDGAMCPSGSVLFITAEDNLADTIRPRLDAHKADLKRIHHLGCVRHLGDDGPVQIGFTLDNVDDLDDALKKCEDCKLVIIDPVGSFFGRGDSYRDNQVRSVLKPIAQLAEKHGPAILLVAHARKAKAQHADDLALGSRAFTASCRAVWHVMEDPEDYERRLLLSGKNNLGPNVEGLAFAIKGENDEPGVVHWESDPVPMRADDLMTKKGNNSEEPGKVEIAGTWLQERLKDGPVPSKEILQRARTLEISERTLKRAKKELGILSERKDFGPKGEWLWSMPASEDDESTSEREASGGDIPSIEGQRRTVAHNEQQAERSDANAAGSS